MIDRLKVKSRVATKPRERKKYELSEVLTRPRGPPREELKKASSNINSSLTDGINNVNTQQRGASNTSAFARS